MKCNAKKAGSAFICIVRIILLFLYVLIFLMDAKLTLKLNKVVIEKAKQYANNKKMSLSRIVEAYLNSITTESKTTDEIEISPFIKSISTGINVPAGLDYKKEYSEALLDKHK